MKSTINPKHELAKNYKTADDILVSDKHGLKPYFFSSFLQEKVHFQALF